MSTKYLINSDTLTNIANAIRQKTGSEDTIAVSDMAATISDIYTGVATPIYAMLYDDGEMVFQLDDTVDESRTLVEKYTASDLDVYCCEYDVPWLDRMSEIKNVSTNGDVPIKTLAHYFVGSSLTEFNTAKFDIESINSMTYAFNRCANITGSPVCGENVTQMSGTYSNCGRLTGSPVCGNNVTSMGQTYQRCYNLTGSPVCGNNVTSMYQTYYFCTNLTGSPICGEKVTDMTGAYFNCNKLTGSPICGENVTGMYQTYQACTNLTGSPVCGNNVTNMAYTYNGCTNLTGSPVCGNNVTNMTATYWNCPNLTGSPVCGEKVIGGMYATYYNCRNLTGSPVCGNNVTNMYNTYCYCTNLTGSPVCGEKVTDMTGAYRGCANLAGNAYFYSSSVSTVRNCFNGKNNSVQMNIYVPAGSKTNTSVHSTTATTSLVGKAITWTSDTANNCSYNTAYNIYIYPVDDVAAARTANGD